MIYTYMYIFGTSSCNTEPRLLPGLPRPATLRRTTWQGGHSAATRDDRTCPGPIGTMLCSAQLFSWSPGVAMLEACSCRNNRERQRFRPKTTLNGSKSYSPQPTQFSSSTAPGAEAKGARKTAGCTWRGELGVNFSLFSLQWHS